MPYSTQNKIVNNQVKPLTKISVHTVRASVQSAFLTGPEPFVPVVEGLTDG